MNNRNGAAIREMCCNLPNKAVNCILSCMYNDNCMTFFPDGICIYYIIFIYTRFNKLHVLNYSSAVYVKEITKYDLMTNSAPSYVH